MQNAFCLCFQAFPAAEHIQRENQTNEAVHYNADQTGCPCSDFFHEIWHIAGNGDRKIRQPGFQLCKVQSDLLHQIIKMLTLATVCLQELLEVDKIDGELVCKVH